MKRQAQEPPILGLIPHRAPDTSPAIYLVVAPFHLIWLESPTLLASLTLPMTSLLRPLVAVIAGSVLATSLFAQASAPKLQFPDASPAATIKQRVGITDVEISYARPSMKGRQVFGGLVPYEQVWRTGANTATKLTLSTPVKLNGTPVDAGSYELFTIPSARGDWTVIIHRSSAPMWGSYAYDQKNDVARFQATPVPLAQPVETFAITFNDLRDTSATLNLMWELVRVPVKIEVDVIGTLVPQIEAVMASTEAKKPYFQSAMFYFENNLDLKKAVAWMNAGLAEQPNAYWMIYRKGLILAKAGDKTGAIAAAQQSLDMVTQDAKAPAPLKAEYTHLNQVLINSLK